MQVRENLSYLVVTRGPPAAGEECGTCGCLGAAKSTGRETSFTCCFVMVFISASCVLYHPLLGDTNPVHRPEELIGKKYTEHLSGDIFACCALLMVKQWNGQAKEILLFL